VHGDIQAVFDSEPPQNIEDEIAEEDDLNHPTLENVFAREFGASAGGKMKMISKKDRRDSVAPFAGLNSRLRDLIHEESDEEDQNDSVKLRLRKLEESTTRIENLLGRLCAELDDGLAKSSDKGENGDVDEEVRLEDVDGNVMDAES
jgi:hypothetical protein